MTFYTLGCKVNQNETAAIKQLFQAAGFTLAQPEEIADIYLVNSCTVTAEGESKSKNWLRRAKRKNPDAITVLTGCAPQAYPDSTGKYEADIVTGTANRAGIVEMVRDYIKNRQRIVEVSANSSVFEELPVSSDAARTRAFVKVQDGCNRRCSYCIIPAARGPARSRDVGSILEEIRVRTEEGCKEIVFTGINLSSYGRDKGPGPGTNLPDLVEEVSKIPGVQRIRLSSLDPDWIREEDIRRFASQEKLCPHFHLSLQSGCDATLRRMRRPYSTALYSHVVQAFRKAIPDCSFTTDVIVGFPGETEADFLESLHFVEKIRFLKVHVFPFSPRPGTLAAEFPDQLSQAVKKDRSARMQAVADRIRAEIIAECKGKTYGILLEKPLEEGVYTGYTQTYIPVLVPAPGGNQGDIVAACLGDFDGEKAKTRLSADF